MKRLVIRMLLLSALTTVFSLSAFAQSRCMVEYRACVRDCNTARDRVIQANNLQRGVIRMRLNQDLLDCTVRFVGDPAGRAACQREARARANRALAAIDASDRQAQRARVSCIIDCRRQIRECERQPVVQIDISGSVVIECPPGGAPCRGAVSRFCQQANGACDNCWVSMCGGGEWQIESEVELSSVTLVAALDRVRNGRVLTTSAINGRQGTLVVPGDLKLRRGEQLYFEVSSGTKPVNPVKLNIKRNRR